MNYQNYQNLMLLTSSDTKRTLMRPFLFTNSAQRELVSICTQSIHPLTFLALHPWLLKLGLRLDVQNLTTFKDDLQVILPVMFFGTYTIYKYSKQKKRRSNTFKDLGVGNKLGGRKITMTGGGLNFWRIPGGFTKNIFICLNKKTFTKI